MADEDGRGRSIRWLALGVLVLLDVLLMRLPFVVTTGRWFARGEYFLTAPVQDSMYGHPILFAALLGAAGIGAAFATRLSVPWIAAAPLAAYVALLVVEGLLESTSHNLLPFELLFVLPAALPQAIGALLVRAMGVGRLPPPAAPRNSWTA